MKYLHLCSTKKKKVTQIWNNMIFHSFLGELLMKIEAFRMSYS